MKTPAWLLMATLFFAAALPAANVHVVKYESQADVKIFFVRYDSQAGWRAQSPFQGQLAAKSQ